MLVTVVVIATSYSSCCMKRLVTVAACRYVRSLNFEDGR